MCASRLLILGLISIIEIGSVQISPKRQTHLWSPFPRHPTVPGSTPAENSHSPQFYSSPNAAFKNSNSPPNPYYRHKKINHWMDPIKFKKPGGLKKLKHAKIPHRTHSSDEKKQRDNYTKTLENLNEPSIYLEPPKLDNSDYDFYAKSKKPSADNSKKENKKEDIESPQNHRLHGEEDEESDEDDRSTYVRDHAPELQVDATDNVRANESEDSNNENVIGAPGSPKDRIEFHIHGHEGPQTYIFGYDTGDGNNRQFRLEERHGDGSVTGQYGYIDARGKLRKVRYKASPTEGYVEKHHETNEQKEEEV